jgi:TolB protein
MGPIKKLSLFLLLLVAASLWLPETGRGIIYIDINSPETRKFYLALPAITALGQIPQGMKEDVEKTITQDLTMADLFYLPDRAKLPAPAAYITEDTVDFKQWEDAGIEFLLSIGLKADRDTVAIEFRLFDVIQHIYIAGKRYTGSPAEVRAMAHRTIDEVIKQLTGERGIFQTKIAFVTDRTGNKEIALMDVDGHNEKMVTDNGSINIFPAWNPDGRSLLYTCFQRRNPDLYQVFLATGSSVLLSAVPGPNASAAWSPDGKGIALMMRGKGNTEIYLLNPQGKDPVQLTRSWDNKTSPAWSPDGKQLAFVSDRSGSPQIYILDLASQKQKRLTYEGSYNCSPAWSPKGDRIAFARQEENGFQIYTIRPDGTDLRRITREGNNENPSWAPDGRHIAFSSRRGGKAAIYITTTDGGGPWKVTTSEANETEPAWSPWLQ